MAGAAELVEVLVLLLLLLPQAASAAAARTVSTLAANGLTYLFT